jgi:hypothetical protein
VGIEHWLHRHSTPACTAALAFLCGESLAAEPRFGLRFFGFPAAPLNCYQSPMPGVDGRLWRYWTFCVDS